MREHIDGTCTCKLDNYVNYGFKGQSRDDLKLFQLIF